MRASVIRGKDTDDRCTSAHHVATASNFIAAEAPRNSDSERPNGHVRTSDLSSNPLRE